VVKRRCASNDCCESWVPRSSIWSPAILLAAGTSCAEIAHRGCVGPRSRRCWSPRHARPSPSDGCLGCSPARSPRRALSGTAAEGLKEPAHPCRMPQHSWYQLFGSRAVDDSSGCESAACASTAPARPQAGAREGLGFPSSVVAFSVASGILTPVAPPPRRSFGAGLPVLHPDLARVTPLPGPSLAPRASLLGRSGSARGNGEPPTPIDPLRAARARPARRRRCPPAPSGPVALLRALDLPHASRRASCRALSSAHAAFTFPVTPPLRRRLVVTTSTPSGRQPWRLSRQFPCWARACLSACLPAVHGRACACGRRRRPAPRPCTARHHPGRQRRPRARRAASTRPSRSRPTTRRGGCRRRYAIGSAADFGGFNCGGDGGMGGCPDRL